MSMAEHRFTHDEAVRPLHGVSEPTLIHDRPCTGPTVPDDTKVIALHDH